jgi:hypothetical protein
MTVFSKLGRQAGTLVYVCAHNLQARSIIDQHILETGSLLLQGLSIASPGACEAFVNGMGFTRQKYEPYGGTRQKVRSRGRLRWLEEGGKVRGRWGEQLP